MNRLFDLLPPNVRDVDSACISAAFDYGFKLLWNAIESVHILADLDSASERALDVMAHDLAIPDYEIGLSRAVKVELVKENVYRNKFTKGTAETVKRAIAILYEGGQVTEWQDIGGNPYTFNVKAIIPNVPDEAGILGFYKRVRETVAHTKNARSHLDSIGLYYPLNTSLHIGAHTRIAQHVTVRPYMPPPMELHTKVASAAWTKVGQHIRILPKEMN